MNKLQKVEFLIGEYENFKAKINSVMMMMMMIIIIITIIYHFVFARNRGIFSGIIRKYISFLLYVLLGPVNNRGRLGEYKFSILLFKEELYYNS